MRCWVTLLNFTKDGHNFRHDEATCPRALSDAALVARRGIGWGSDGTLLDSGQQGRDGVLRLVIPVVEARLPCDDPGKRLIVVG
jgi:hypothetical protein